MFFHLNFLNAWGILAKKIYNVHTIFCQFSDAKNRGRSQQPRVLGQLVTGEPQCTRTNHPKESNATNAILFSIVFFACGVHKLNYIIIYFKRFCSINLETYMKLQHLKYFQKHTSMNLVKQWLECTGFINNEITEIFTLCYNFITTNFCESYS